MRRKKFIPKILLVFLFWGTLFYLVFQLPPDKFYHLAIFFPLFFLAFGLTLSLILNSKKYAFLLSLTLTIFLFLRFLKMANLLNIILLLALTLTLGLFLHPKSARRQPDSFPRG
ncbi:MAG: hypothetical protein Q8P89_03265 [bacterium]|nr:hypothetical protein [bacterium]